MLIPDPNFYSVGIPQSYWDEVEEQFLDVQYEISSISKALNRLCQREFGDITSVSPNMAGEDYTVSDTQVEMSPAQDVSCTEHFDSPSNVQQTGTAHEDSPIEAVIPPGMSLPTEPQSTAMPKPSSIGNVLTKGSFCVPCSPIMQALAHSESDLCHKECNVILNPSSSPTHCVDLDKTLVPMECKCALSHSCHMGFDPGDHCDCVSRKEYASLLNWVEALEKALQYQIAQGHNSLLSLSWFTWFPIRCGR